MARRVSTNGISEIVRHEGEILYVYADPVGLLTMGVGHLLTPTEKRIYTEGQKITREFSRRLLRKDLQRFEDCVDKLVRVPLTQNQFDSLVSLAFNIGEANFERSTLLKRLNQKDYDGAARAFMSWTKARENGVLKELPGLVTRRKAEKRIFLTPDAQTALAVDPDPEEGDGGTQTTPPNPSPSNFAPTPAPEPQDKRSLNDKANSIVDTGLSWVDRFADTQTRVSRSSWLVAMGSRLGGALLMLIAENWELFLLGILLIVLASIFIRHKKRKVRRSQLD